MKVKERKKYMCQHITQTKRKERQARKKEGRKIVSKKRSKQEEQEPCRRNKKTKKKIEQFNRIDNCCCLCCNRPVSGNQLSEKKKKIEPRIKVKEYKKKIMDPASVLGVGPTFWFRTDERVTDHETKLTAINNKLLKSFDRG